MVSCLGSCVRSRKLHSVIALFIILAACFYSFGGRGFAIAHSRGGAYAHELSYATTAETLSSGYTVSDLFIQKCVRGVSCQPPKDGEMSYWEKVPVKLNLFPSQKQSFNYFLYVEKSKVFESARYVIDVSFTTTDSPPSPLVEGAVVDVKKISPDGYMWIQYITEVMPQVPMVRDVNVLFGKKGMKDPRKYWKMNPDKIPIPGHYDIHGRMTTLSANLLQEISILQKEKEFEEILKKNEILVSPHPKFKIMQIGDMALRERAYRTCEGSYCAKDLDTLRFIESALRQEKDVQLVIITGFTVISNENDHPESVILEALSPILESGIPFIFASSDGISHWENPNIRKNFNNFLASLPGCYNKKFDQLDHRIHGTANGNLKLYNIPRAPAGVPTDYQEIISKDADAFVTYLDSKNAMLDPSHSNYLYRINKLETAKTEHKLLFLDYPFVSKTELPRDDKHRLLSVVDFKRFLDDFRVNGYKAIAFNNPSFEGEDGRQCEWQDTEDSKVLKCSPGMVGAMWGGAPIDKRRELRLYEFDFQENKIVSWLRNSDGAADAQLIWTGEPMPQTEEDSEKKVEEATEEVTEDGTEKGVGKEAASDSTADPKGAEKTEKVAQKDGKKDATDAATQGKEAAAGAEKGAGKEPAAAKGKEASGAVSGSEKSANKESDATKGKGASGSDSEKVANKDTPVAKGKDTSGAGTGADADAASAKANQKSAPAKGKQPVKSSAEELAEEVAEEMTEAENEAEAETSKPDTKKGADKAPK